MYVNKLFEFFDDDDENKVMWYRNVFYFWVKIFFDCFFGRFISR